MSINYKTLDKLLVLGQIAKQELEFVDVIASCSPMRNGDYSARKYAIIEEYNTQKSKLEEEFKKEKEAFESRNSLKNKMDSFLDNAESNSITFNQTADQIINLDHVDDLDEL
jgi:hypothetical protein